MAYYKQGAFCSTAPSYFESQHTLVHMCCTEAAAQKKQLQFASIQRELRPIHGVIASQFSAFHRSIFCLQSMPNKNILYPIGLVEVDLFTRA